jgi:hypothetical protein
MRITIGKLENEGPTWVWVALVRCGVSQKVQSQGRGTAPLSRKVLKAVSLRVKLRCKPKRKSNFGGWREVSRDVWRRKRCWILGAGCD